MRFLQCIKTCISHRKTRWFYLSCKVGTLKFKNVIHANLQYGIQWDEWSETYRSAVLESSNLIDSIPIKARQNKAIKHIYLGIDNGVDYKEFDIVCTNYDLSLEEQEYVLYDDFDWLNEN